MYCTVYMYEYKGWFLNCDKCTLVWMRFIHSNGSEVSVRKYFEQCNFRKNIISKKHELLKNRKTKISLIATRNKWTKFHGNWQLFFFRRQSVKNPSYETVQNIKNALTLQFIFKWSFLNIYQSAAERESWKLENCWIDKNNVSDSWNVIKTYDF